MRDYTRYPVDRIGYAAYLRGKGLTLKAVAEELGFKDPSYLGKLIKKHIEKAA